MPPRTRPAALPARFDPATITALAADFYRDCGARVGRRRRLSGIQPRELAELCGVTPATISRLEAGTIRPRDELRITVAAVLGCEVNDLWPYPPSAVVHRAAARAVA